jgi:hypothetical protein
VRLSRVAYRLYKYNAVSLLVVTPCAHPLAQLWRPTGGQRLFFDRAAERVKKHHKIKKTMDTPAAAAAAAAIESHGNNRQSREVDAS